MIVFFNITITLNKMFHIKCYKTLLFPKLDIAQKNDLDKIYRILREKNVDIILNFN